MTSFKNIFNYTILIVLLFSSCKKESPVQTPSAIGAPVIISPSAPINLQIISMTESEVKLHWIDSSTSETSFIIEQGTDTTNFAIVKTVEANIDSTTITGTFLTTKTYYFRVKAKNITYTSNASNVVLRSLFPPPTNCSINSFSPTAVSISWNDNSDNESGFILEQSIDSLAYSSIDSTGANVTSKSISGIFDSTKTYSFRVFARNANNTSAYSNAEARTLGSWVFVAGGTFQMGRDGQFKDERPIHLVILSNYYISKYEVTVKEYREFTTATNRTFPSAPSWGWNDDAPMVKVSWNDARDYCAWLDTITGKKVRLPTEAEWEYAARGGKNSQRFAYCGSNTLNNVAWNYLNANSRTYQCGLKKSNELGIFDMSGNAWEWCSDWQGSYSSAIQRNPTGPASGSNKIFRGGSWFDYGLGESECRVETRYTYTPNSKVDDGGFRIVKEP
jgi:formylglycine-generating enzyme required for sulfatase activity